MTNAEENPTIPNEATAEIIDILRKYKVEGYLQRIVISARPDPKPRARGLITYYYEIDGVCWAYPKPQNLPACKLWLG